MLGAAERLTNEERVADGRRCAALHLPWCYHIRVIMCNQVGGAVWLITGSSVLHSEVNNNIATQIDVAFQACYDASNYHYGWT